MRILKRPLFWIVVLIGLAIAFGVVRAVGKRHIANAPVTLAAPTTTAIELLPTDLTVAQRGPIVRSLAVTGTLQPVNMATLKSKVTGDVIDVLVREGETVKAGQVLAHIDPTEFRFRSQQASENMAAAQGQLDIAKKTRDDNSKLVAQGFISGSALATSEAQLATAQANVEANRAALDLARKSLDDATVRAPIDGVVSARLVNPGEKVSIDERLFDLVDLRLLELAASVPAAEIGEVMVGQPMTIRPEGSTIAVAGQVVRINPSNQSGSRSYLVYARVPNADAHLRAGLFARGTIVLERKKDALVVPRTAVRASGDGQYIYSVDVSTAQGGKPTTVLGLHAVTLGLRGGDGDNDVDSLVEVTDGIAPGTRMVRVNLGTLTPGAPVRVLAPSPVASSATSAISTPAAAASSSINAAP